MDKTLSEDLLFHLDRAMVDLSYAVKNSQQLDLSEADLTRITTQLKYAEETVNRTVVFLEEKTIPEQIFSVSPVTTEKLLEIVKQAEQDLIAGTALYKIQEMLRRHENAVNTMPLVERYQAACYDKRKDNVERALIHCRGILNCMT